MNLEQLYICDCERRSQLPKIREILNGSLTLAQCSKNMISAKTKKKHPNWFGFVH